VWNASAQTLPVNLAGEPAALPKRKPMKTFILIALFLTSPAYANDVINIIACECSGESFEGQLSVASVIKTRMIERKQTAEQVVKARKQFSCWDGKKVVRSLTLREIETARKAWEESKAGEYNHYYAHRIVTPSWSIAAKKIKVIGNHTFIKL